MTAYAVKAISAGIVIVASALLGRAMAASYRARPQTLCAWMGAFQGLLNAIMSGDMALDDALISRSGGAFGDIFRHMAEQMRISSFCAADAFFDAFGASDMAQDWLSEDISEAGRFFARLSRAYRGEIGALSEDFAAQWSQRVNDAQSERSSSERLMSALGALGGIALALFII